MAAKKKRKKVKAAAPKRKAAKKKAKRKASKRKASPAQRKALAKGRAVRAANLKRKKRATNKRKKAAKYRRQRKAYSPLLSPGIAAQQLRHRASLKQEAKARAQLSRDMAKLTKTKRRKVSGAVQLVKGHVKLTKAEQIALVRESFPVSETAARAVNKLKGLVKTPLQLRLFDEKPGRAYRIANPRRRKKARKTAKRRRNPNAGFWIADLYKGGRRTTYIDRCTQAEAAFSAKQLASRSGSGARVELYGPYATRPTASTARK